MEYFFNSEAAAVSFKQTYAFWHDGIPKSNLTMTLSTSPFLIRNESPDRHRAAHRNLQVPPLPACAHLIGHHGLKQ